MGRASRRKAGRTPQSLLDKARSAIQAVAGTKDVVVVSNSPEEEKISHALCMLLQEEVPDDSPLEEYRAALSVIVTAWNLSLLDAEKRSAALKNFTTPRKGEDPAIVPEALGHVERLIAKKQALFPRDRRHVVSFNVRFENGEVRVLAAAIIKPGDA
ncbi:MAG: hypothetical protein IPK02_00905 [Candidatus Accumulibacter sp.]|uniref:Uncharacterized protein n=1 Tax=Candidatus Accumulibacter affinis TaxID=2954384 RepID=A0A935TA07_9PROT|nr:hypothetical protein [Candidatus Accumulibacter affinis]